MDNEENEHEKAWRKLAQEQRDLAAYEKSRGQYAGVHENRAKLCDNTAEGMRLTRTTGKKHCPDHLTVPCPALDARKGA